MGPEGGDHFVGAEPEHRVEKAAVEGFPAVPPAALPGWAAVRTAQAGNSRSRSPGL